MKALVLSMIIAFSGSFAVASCQGSEAHSPQSKEGKWTPAMAQQAHGGLTNDSNSQQVVK